MPFHVKSAEATALLEELRRATGEGVTEAVTEALRRRLEEVRSQRETRFQAAWAAVREIQERVAALPVVDPRSPRELADALYDDRGLPR